jgi:hypothetical protein
MKKRYKLLLLLTCIVAVGFCIHYILSIRVVYPEGELSYLYDSNYNSHTSESPSLDTLKYLYVSEYGTMYGFDILVDFPESKVYLYTGGPNKIWKSEKFMYELNEDMRGTLKNLLEEYDVKNWRKNYNIVFSNLFSTYKWTVSMEFEDGTVQIHKGRSSTPHNFKAFMSEVHAVALELYPEYFN